MNEVAVSVIQEYIDEHLFEPASNWPKYYFQERSYSRWAAYEIKNRNITKNETPVDIINDFINEMNQFEELNNKFIFSVARDAAKQILYLFL